MTDTQAIIVLNAIPGLGNSRIRKLIHFFGCATDVLKADASMLQSAHVLPADVIDNIIRFRADEFLAAETALMDKWDVSAFAFTDPGYPAALHDIADAPVVLYVKGFIPGAIAVSVAVVGSRKASVYGLAMAEKFARELAESGVCIISGLARGIDTAAHEGALKARGTTVAVLGSGLACIYPRENEKLYYDIALHGAVLSEYPMTMGPMPVNFPRRNRIVSGLSLGVLVIEAMHKSGALITADCALEQGREVFAVPGPINSPYSSGVNHLIQQGAKLVCSKEDILEELMPPSNAQGLPLVASGALSPKAPAVDLEALNDREKNIFQVLQKTPMHMDDIAATVAYSCEETGAILLNLELKHIVKQLPGKYFAVHNQ